MIFAPRSLPAIASTCSKRPANPAKVEFVEACAGFTLPLDIIVNDDSIWVTDLGPLRFVKLDFKGNHLYTWLVPKDLPDGLPRGAHDQRRLER